MVLCGSSQNRPSLYIEQNLLLSSNYHHGVSLLSGVLFVDSYLAWFYAFFFASCGRTLFLPEQSSSAGGKEVGTNRVPAIELWYGCSAWYGSENRGEAFCLVLRRNPVPGYQAGMAPSYGPFEAKAEGPNSEPTTKWPIERRTNQGVWSPRRNVQFVRRTMGPVIWPKAKQED